MEFYMGAYGEGQKIINVSTSENFVYIEVRFIGGSNCTVS